MKRRVISFMTGLALCLSLCPMWAFAAGQNVTLNSDKTGSAYIITYPFRFDAGGYTYTVSDKTAMSVQNGGSLYLMNGTVKSDKGAGVEVKNGGSLIIEVSGTTVIGTTYGLDISSGAKVQLSGGTFSATNTNGVAINKTEDVEYGDLLKVGYAFFDESGHPITPAGVEGKKTVAVKECTDHLHSYTANDETPTHNGICEYCKTEVTKQPCTFNFDSNGSATCAGTGCGHSIRVTIKEPSGDLVYNGESQPDSVEVEVILDDGKTNSKTLTEDTDYTVEYTTRVDAGEVIAVTVKGKTYNGTYTAEACRVSKDRPEIKWAGNTPTQVDYNGKPVELLQYVDIKIKATGSVGEALKEELKGALQFSYRKTADANGDPVADSDFTEGLPTDAGTYEIIASLPEKTNYDAASSGSFTLMINKINPFKDGNVPKAVENLVYDRTVHELVTPGTVWDGAAVQFAFGKTDKDGKVTYSEYSEAIPTGTDAGNYVVRYKVDATNNFNADNGTFNVTIERKPVTPDVILEYTSVVYDGGEKQPKVTVIDTDDDRTLPSTEYKVTYTNNQDKGTATVTVADTDAHDGNYEIGTVTRTFEITAADQAALTVTNQPDRVFYGDKFTLGTSGGSGSGNVTWEITAVKNATGAVYTDKADFIKVATVDPASGQVTVTGLGTVTVRATKSDGDPNGGNHKDATAEWTFTVDPKPVVAVVIAANKPYDGKDTATVTAEVPAQDLVSGDKITIDGLSGTFSDANAGTYKAVTVTGTATIEVNGEKLVGAKGEKYTVTIPTASVRADITKAETSIKDGTPTTKALTYNGKPQDLLASKATASTTTGVVVTVEYALRESGLYSTDIPKATDAGSYEVWYRVRESDNYFGTAAKSVTVTIAPKDVTAYVELDQNSYVYDGTEKKPAVTVKEGDTNGDVISSDEYTVTYRNNVNAGKATVTVTARTGGNYTFNNSGPVTAEFTITTGGKAVLTSSPQARNLTYNGQAQELVTVGTATGGHLEYSLSENSGFSNTIPTGTNAGEYTVYYMVKGDGNFEDSAVSSVSVTIQPKTVTSPVITLVGENADGSYSVEYNGGEQKPGVASVADGGKTIEAGEYTVTWSNNINAGTATVHIVDNNGGNYNVSGSKTFEITKATAKFVEDKEPKAISGLTYNAKAQALITAGVADGGTAVYSLGDINGPYFTTIPTGTDHGEYKVWAKVQGDANHKDSESIEIENVKIDVNNVTTLHVELSSVQFQYNGSEQKPTVTVWDGDWNVIPANEYTVEYVAHVPDTNDADGPNGSEGVDEAGDTDKSVDTVNPGKYDVVIKSKGINYSFAEQRFTVEILPADQTPLEITGKPSKVCFGDTIQLGTTGGSGNGTVTWSIVNGSGLIEEGESEGQFIITGVGDITIKAVRDAGSSYTAAETTWTFHAYPKSVTAVVVAMDKVYDGNNTAELVSVTVSGTDIEIAVNEDYKEQFKGSFDSPNVGTNKTVTFADISGHVTVTNGDNYEITYPTTTTASIKPAEVAVAETDKPKGTNPEYNGSLQSLVVGGAALDGGNWAYSLDGVNYSFSIPEATNADDYTVWYKVIADSNHKDIAPATLTVKISPKKVTPKVLCSPETFPYDGTDKTPNVIVTYTEDGVDKVIPASEYTLTLPQRRSAIDDYTVTVTSGGNYKFIGDATGTFKIVQASQAPLSIVTDIASTVYFGDTFRLSAIGGSGTGAIVWESKNTDVATVNSETGVVEVIGTGSFTITAIRSAPTDGSYGESNTASITFKAEKKPVTAVVSAIGDMVYDKDRTSNTKFSLSVTVPGTDIKIEGVTGTFDDVNVGIDKTVKIHYEGRTVTGDTYYQITWPTTTTASITPAPAAVPENVLTVRTDLTYTGKPQEFLTVASATVEGGDLAYSLDGTNYSLAVPTITNAGTHTVWYKVRGDSNHTDSEVKTVTVTIAKATPTISTKPVASPVNYGQRLENSELSGGKAISEGVEVPGTFTWTNPGKYPSKTAQREAVFTPTDKINYETVTVMVTVTVNGVPAETPDESGTGSASMQTVVLDGTASTVLNTAAGDELVNAAVANESKNIVIKPEITDDVTKTEVSFPASMVSRISGETDAALTVSTPIADVTIPNGSLETLSGASGTVNIVTERTENTVVLTLTADGKDMGDIPGGLTLTVSVENAGPGMVAVLVYEDGTREMVRRSVAEEGGVRIPLNGSATVAIVDNSKEFVDVPTESWAADAVTFASAHELFNGTGKATFSPELLTSRAMLATVLYNLEGCPAQDLTGEFSDVNGRAWYAAGVSWAAASGVVGGNGDGQFDPNGSITREQIALMLWRYAGSPETDEQDLNFTDADQASGYAVEALCWAAANSIINGYGDGRLDPDGLATRAQAAQMLKNFLVNI